MAYSNLYAKFYNMRERSASALAAVWRFYPSRYYFIALAISQIVAWFQASFIYRHLSGDFLVLHYNVDFGIDLVGSPWKIFIYPLYGLGLFIVNLIVTAAFNRHKDFRVFAHFLLTAAVIFCLSLNLALLFVYLINFK